MVDPLGLCRAALSSRSRSICSTRPPSHKPEEWRFRPQHDQIVVWKERSPALHRLVDQRRQIEGGGEHIQASVHDTRRIQHLTQHFGHARALLLDGMDGSYH